MRSDALKIPSPCSADWSTMAGDDRKRFCTQCQKHVHDLSAMTEPQARAVLAQPRVCVRYTARADGQVQFRPASRRALLQRGALAAGLLAVSLPAAAAMSTAEPAATSCSPQPGLLARLWSALTGTPATSPAPEAGQVVMMGDVPEPMLAEPEQGELESVFYGSEGEGEGEGEGETPEGEE